MTQWVLLAAAALLGVWLLETVLFVVSYRSNRRLDDPADKAEQLS